ncbi:hypothetical protein MT344_04115 [Clavibacter michiganensis subsp. phaseoli]|uniref:hypothetical protein n=1 Tax=Clavibacter phaseoli TaxID=1734031 RepID=UPI001FB2AB45|nr:hypothetical protein [Clavibacter phaseoli]MCJ1710368.1 hypothetical protein [Clavibacter phaseoli]
MARKKHREGRTVDLPEILRNGRPADATEIQVARLRARVALEAPTEEDFEAEVAKLDPFDAEVARWWRSL